ncbi:hypothetical protein PHMEG_00012692 [Phytophthora megakarya]|uniref:Uncharacterized protein n=1 Tax=Phytophthora megakarya TaxID=4795 RepID=A0A225W840_9STRA|nr:hypothetical protein PHMEG_00012692 [Phytophthora megakarya]
MNRFLAEQQAAEKGPHSLQILILPNHGMLTWVSVRSSDRGSNWKYDPDDIDFLVPAHRL